MSQSIATNPHQTSPYRHGNILFANVATYQRNPPGIGRCLSQGAAVGVFVGFLSPVFSMLSHPENGYNFLLISYLPLLLAFGLAFGVLEGVLIWACNYIVGHRLHAVVRAVVGVISLAILLTGYNFLFAEPSPYREEVSTIDYVFFYGVYIGYGVLFGLVIGSRFEPVAELLRGTSPPQWLVVTGLTGLALRVFVIFGLMESVLNLIWTLQRERIPAAEFAFGVIALSHFIAGVVIIFVRMPFWLLLPLALIINLPIVALITDVLTEKEFPLQYITIGYLSLWAAFLLTRVRVPEAPLSFIKKEIRYYLID